MQDLHQCAQTGESVKGTEVALCGILTGVVRKRNKEQKLWASMQLEDLEGAGRSDGFHHPV